MASANIYDINKGAWSKDVPVSKKANDLSEKADGSRIHQEFRSEFLSEKQMASAYIYDINKGAWPEDVPISKKANVVSSR